MRWLENSTPSLPERVDLLPRERPRREVWCGPVGWTITMEVDQIRGVLVGAACGDALGAGVEFLSPAEIARRHGRVTDFVGGGVFGWEPGEATDDTDLMLCLLDTYLAHRGELDVDDFARRLVAWFASGPKDVGNLTARAISLLAEGRRPTEAGRVAWEESGRDSAGNGSVMRCAPTALFRWGEREHLERESRLASQVTHYDPRAQDACVVVNTVLASLLEGGGSREAIDEGRSLEGLDWRTRDALDDLARGDPGRFDLAGYCLGTVQVGLWALLAARSFEEGLVEVVNLGYDADTNAAVAGVLLGARFGYSEIPVCWREGLLRHGELLERAERVEELLA